jgi:hypothetical protein
MFIDALCRYVKEMERWFQNPVQTACTGTLNKIGNFKMFFCIFFSINCQFYFYINAETLFAAGRGIAPTQ